MSKQEKYRSIFLFLLVIISVISCALMHFFLPGFNWYIGSFIIMIFIIALGLYGFTLFVGKKLLSISGFLSPYLIDSLFLCISQKWTTPTWLISKVNATNTITN